MALPNTASPCLRNSCRDLRSIAAKDRACAACRLANVGEIVAMVPPDRLVRADGTMVQNLPRSFTRCRQCNQVTRREVGFVFAAWEETSSRLQPH